MTARDAVNELITFFKKAGVSNRDKLVPDGQVGTQLATAWNEMAGYADREQPLMNKLRQICVRLGLDQQIHGLDGDQVNAQARNFVFGYLDVMSQQMGVAG